MFQKYTCVIFVLLLVLGGTSCSKTNEIPKNNTSEQLIHSRIYATLNMNAIEVQKNEVFEVVVDANPSTGFLWEINGELPKSIIFISNELEIPAIDTLPKVGQESKETWTFKAVEKGLFSFKMKFIQPFNPDHIEEERTVEVRVK